MNLSEMREMPPVEIQSEIEKSREKIWKMRFQAKGEPLENAGALRRLKKDVARLMTVLREKQGTAGGDLRGARGQGGGPAPVEESRSAAAGGLGAGVEGEPGDRA
ncbi:MAG: 50S ribosomal protein L29 [Planctomycetes bacterium]|nr:50S ribosomal protein L29 [Planctomycetota bacterium]